VPLRWDAAQAHVTGKTGDSPVNAPTTLIDWTTPVPRHPSCDHDKNSTGDPTPTAQTSDIPELDPTVADDPGTFTAANPATAAAEDAAVRAWSLTSTLICLLRSGSPPLPC